MTVRSRAGILAFCVLGAIAHSAAADLDAPARTEIAALATGAMAKLTVHDAPRDPMTEPFLDKNGNSLTLERFAGRVVVVNFWATWCPPCVAEMPSLDRLAGTLDPAQAVVVAVSNDRGDIAKVTDFYAETGVEHLAAYQDRQNGLARRAGILGLPVTLILDRQGREIARLIGDAEWDSAEAQAILARLIALTAPAG